MAKLPPEPGATHALALVSVPFEGTIIEAAQNGDHGERFWSPARSMCELLGISESRQVKKLKMKHWATVALKATVGEDGKVREQLCVDDNTLAMWLATIEPSRVKESARPLLLAYQKGLVPAVREHFRAFFGLPPGGPDLRGHRDLAGPRDPPEPAELAAAAELLGGIDPRVRAALRKLPPPRRPSVEHWLGQARELAQLVERSDVPLPADSLTCARLASSLILATSAAPDHPLVLGTRDDLRRTLALIDRLLTRAACDLELEPRVTDLRARWLRESAHLTR